MITDIVGLTRGKVNAPRPYDSTLRKEQARSREVASLSDSGLVPLFLGNSFHARGLSFQL